MYINNREGWNSRGGLETLVCTNNGGGIWLKHQHELIGTGSVPC